MLRHKPLLSPLTKSLWDYKVPTNLNNWWYFGSLLGFMLVNQIVSGTMLAMHYVAHVDYAFDSVVHINRDVYMGSLVRGFHINGASLFFLFMYIHMGRSIYYGCYRQAGVWYSGMVLMLLLMATSFLGYVLPWGQMSYWASVVITSLLSTVPLFGQALVEWIWGGFSVGQGTLTRFYALHFILPFVMCIVTLIHLAILHKTGSSNPLGVADLSGVGERSFHPMFSTKDMFFMLIAFYFLLKMSVYYTWVFVPAENWIKCNPMVTPKHISPEWYFLWLYAILRCAPTKEGGVLLMILALVFLAILPMAPKMRWQGGAQYSPLAKLLFISWVLNFMYLTWIGGKPAEWPYNESAVRSVVGYFLFFPTFIWAIYRKGKKFSS
uniref:cytochrome b n=1 Tax=Lingula reevii TaxID=2792136 RepID=UPI002E793F74|nr:cytochrome b [Lingula reevii]WQG15349.1 cytochrome b [Lingula reevii]